MKKLILILVVLLTQTALFGQENKVLIIGIDGCRADALLVAQTPNIDQLWKEGAYLFAAKTDKISYSGPGWTGMLTGVWSNKHHVTNNLYTNPNKKRYSHFFHRVKEQYPNKKTASVVHWAPIHKILQKGDADIQESYSSDKEVAQRAIEVIENENVDVLFVHFDAVDHAGHTKGFSIVGKDYIDAIQATDDYVGQIMNALDQLPKEERKKWTVIVSTDHGGNGFNHGKNIPIHRNIFYIINGDKVKKGEILKPVNVIDVATTAMKILGVQQKLIWNLDGKVSGL